jgi:hypothetical protein
MSKRLLLMVIAGGSAMAVLVPPAASASSPSKCTSHNVSYVAHGAYVSSSVPLAPTSSWSGTLTIKLQSANHQFKQANNLSVKKTSKGTAYTYTIANAAVHFGKGVKKPAKVGDHVTVTGTVTEYGRACTSTTPTIAVHAILVSS